MGRWSRDFGIAIVTATLASLMISLTLIPLAASHIFTGKERPRARFLMRMGDSYGRSISKVIKYRFAALLIFLAISWGAWQLYQSIDRDWQPRIPERRRSSGDSCRGPLCVPGWPPRIRDRSPWITGGPTIPPPASE